MWQEHKMTYMRHSREKTWRRWRETLSQCPAGKGRVFTLSHALWAALGPLLKSSLTRCWQDVLPGFFSRNSHVGSEEPITSPLSVLKVTRMLKAEKWVVASWLWMPTCSLHIPQQRLYPEICIHLGWPQTRCQNPACLPLHQLYSCNITGLIDRSSC